MLWLTCINWIRRLSAILFFLASVRVPMAAGAEADAGRFFDPSRLLTTGGLLYQPSLSFSLEPMIGLDYRQRLEERSAPWVDHATV